MFHSTRLITLLNEVLRVLRPAASSSSKLLTRRMFVVGSNYFYMDPTHRHPLPTELMEFLFENRGFRADRDPAAAPVGERRAIAGESEVGRTFQ